MNKLFMTNYTDFQGLTVDYTYCEAGSMGLINEHELYWVCINFGHLGVF